MTPLPRIQRFIGVQLLLIGAFATGLGFVWYGAPMLSYAGFALFLAGAAILVYEIVRARRLP